MDDTTALFIVSLWVLITAAIMRTIGTWMMRRDIRRILRYVEAEGQEPSN